MALVPKTNAFDFAAAYAALCRSGVHNLRVVTRSYSLSQLSLLKTHETLVPSVGRFQSADRIIAASNMSFVLNDRCVIHPDFARLFSQLQFGFLT